MDCFIPNFKMKYDDSENIKADRVNTAVYTLYQIKRRAFFLGHPVIRPGAHSWEFTRSKGQIFSFSGIAATSCQLA